MNSSDVPEPSDAFAASGSSRGQPKRLEPQPPPRQPAPAPDPAPTWARDEMTIPDMRLIRRIGSGSYGEVWLAQTITGALRAVKVVWREDFEHEKTFRREFEGIQQFEPISRGHPGLVNILHVGWNEQRGFYYYVMELADDAEHGTDIDLTTYVPRTLTTDFKRLGRLDLGFCRDIGLYLADALGYMHSYGLTHRDIKPSNIIFVGGVCKLADIGLVATHGERSFVGTEGFVPPEGPGTFAADIYSLGKVLYEISSGKDRMEFPEVPDDLVASEWILWREWNAVICRACSPDLKERFANAAEFAEALHTVGVPKRVSITKKLLNAGLKLVVYSIMAGTLLAMARREVEWKYLTDAPDASKQTPEELIKAKQPNPGRIWMNSASIKFNWRGDRHVAEKPVNLELFSRYLEAAMQSFEGDVVPILAKTAKPEYAVMVPKADAQAFCEWITNQDRASGVLTNDYEYKWQPDPNVKRNPSTKGSWNAVKLEVARLHFGEIVVDSTPSGAEVIQGSELLGLTPLSLNRVRVGDLAIDIHLPGYRREPFRGKVVEGKKLEVNLKLKATGAVVFGSPWKDSLGLDFVPLGEVLMASTETRQKDYAAYLRAIPTTELASAPSTPEGTLPITHVTRADAIHFCQWLTYVERSRGLLEKQQGYRLPSDDEWSMAAGLPRERGVTPAERNQRIEGIYPWGFAWPPLPAVGNLWDFSGAEKVKQSDGISGFKDGFAELAPVASFPADQHNLFDLSGNVWEWVEDDFGGKDPEKEHLGVLRGGSWRTKVRVELLASHRQPVPATTQSDEVGFRIVLSPVGIEAREGD